MGKKYGERKRVNSKQIFALKGIRWGERESNLPISLGNIWMIIFFQKMVIIPLSTTEEEEDLYVICFSLKKLDEKRDNPR